MRLIVRDSAEEAARVAAREIAVAIGDTLASRERCVLALSRLDSTSPFFEELRRSNFDWTRLHVIQVDERVVDETDPRRNALHLRKALVEEGALPAGQLHAMPVDARDLERAAREYERLIAGLTGQPLCIDVVHLGLGADGHTASLVPGDGVLEERSHAVAVTAPYGGVRRMTLTYPALNAAGHLIWLATGEAKRAALRNLLDGTGDAPAVRVSRARAVACVDRAAAPDAS